jgi:hypothetical protein
MRRFFWVWLASLVLASCDSQPVATTTPVLPPAAKPTQDRPVAPPLAPDTIDYTRSHYSFPDYKALTDTLVSLGSRHRWLRIELTPDSTKPLDYGPAAIAGQPFAAPSDSAWQAHRIRGYDGTFTFSLRDSARHTLVFSQQLHKRDFLRASSQEIVTVSDPFFSYLGYSRGLNALLFAAYFAIPYSDVCTRATMLLDAKTGRVLALRDAGSASFEATDCDPQVSANGQAVLTCADELLRAGRPPVSLRRPHAQLWAAHFLSDTTLLVVYNFGDYRPSKPDPARTSADPTADPSVSAGFSLPETEFVSTPAQRRAANAFILGTSGHVLSKFKYEGSEPGMSEVLPRYFSPITRSYYLVSESKDLILLPKARPGTFLKIPLKTLPKYQPPQRAQEFKFTLQNGVEEFTCYVDKNNPRAIRLRRHSLN